MEAKLALKKLLLKTITNLTASGVLSPSGGLEKPITVVIWELFGTQLLKDMHSDGKEVHIIEMKHWDPVDITV